MKDATSNRHRRRDRQLAGWLRDRGGIAHTSDARSAGYTPREIARLVDKGSVRRVRKSWLVRDDVASERVAAIEVGGRLTCVSAAKSLGLWTPDHDDVHVAVFGNASRFSAEGLCVHWANGPAPVSRGIVEDPIVNVLFHVARCQPQLDAIAVWESAIRKRIADPATLALVAWRSPAAAEIAAVASSLSDSGLETRFVAGMRRCGIEVRQQVLLDGRRVDGLIGEFLVIQLDGFAHHSSPAERRRDIAADARLTLRGYTVLRFDYQQVYFAWDEVVATIRLAMAQGLHQRARGTRR